MRKPPAGIPNTCKGPPSSTVLFRRRDPIRARWINPSETPSRWALVGAGRSGVYRGFICILFIRINTIYPINSPRARRPSALLLPSLDHPPSGGDVYFCSQLFEVARFFLYPMFLTVDWLVSTRTRILSSNRYVMHFCAGCNPRRCDAAQQDHKSRVPTIEWGQQSPSLTLLS